MSFETKLNEGIFCIPECNECKKIVWPPAEFCSHCFGTVSPKEGDFEGKIIEFSSKNGQCFCVVEFEKAFRIIATISKTPGIGQSVKISKCGISDGNYSFVVI
ncbi:MAG: zinc ribbon domain-containing protein [Nitrosopumilus sp.]|nr:zinc ribbon domain-containing protein [Nitrosopumilus sp.]MDF2422972.1 zinc ribbon domain-containing protein [Nitrosopumilus sp.]MDF2423984.1 zinc ribbon domain-containing protein [Nitrosopumilus sp.]MDF2428759.1 zinc ribbon domain-containing protein [Nitrosopumilus sp.]MDF2430114.1 zinc ribbon domain-containing protein [Nitrosopumilus sp.]